jgi:AcrR family transcriptional regulator
MKRASRKVFTPLPDAGPGAPRRRHDVASLVEVAVRVFAERGYDGTSIGDIARAAGIAKSSVYHHVGSKEELLERAFQHVIARYQEMERDIVLSGKTAMDRLRMVCRTAIRLTVEEDPSLTFVRRIPWMSTTAPWALARYKEYEALTGRYVRDAIYEGGIRDDVDQLLLSRFFFFATTGVADIHRLDRTKTVDELTDLALRLLLEGAARR